MATVTKPVGGQVKMKSLREVREALKPGSVIMIYAAPWTCENAEGRARLIRYLDVLYRGLELWEVEFIETGDRVNRIINPHCYE